MGVGRQQQVKSSNSNNLIKYYELVYRTPSINPITLQNERCNYQDDYNFGVQVTAMQAMSHSLCRVATSITILCICK